VAVIYYIFGRLKPREAAAALRHLEFRSAELEAVANLVPETQKVVAVLKGRKTNTPKDAYVYIASLPAEVLAFIEVELPNPKAMSKIRNYFQKWRPMRAALPANELEALGIARGPQFDKILEQLFDMQLRGKARNPEDRTKILRQLAGIKEEPKKKLEKSKKKGKGDVEEAPVQAGAKQPEKTPRPNGSAAPATSTGVAKPTKGPSKSAAAAIGAKAQVKHNEAAAGSRAKAAPKQKGRPAKKARR